MLNTIKRQVIDRTSNSDSSLESRIASVVPRDQEIRTEWMRRRAEIGAALNTLDDANAAKSYAGMSGAERSELGQNVQRAKSLLSLTDLDASDPLVLHVNSIADRLQKIMQETTSREAK